MICPKCNAEIPDGSARCPECNAEFERHISSFAGSVHWEDEVKPPKSEKQRIRSIIIWSIVAILVIAFFICLQCGVFNWLLWRLYRF